MKKIIFFLILFISPLLFSTTAFAQTVQITGFDYSLGPVVRSYFLENESEPKKIGLAPFTTVAISPGTFDTDAQINVYKGAWEEMKKLIPQNQSPIASYYLFFYDGDGNEIKPKKALVVESINNYTGTDTFFYPIGPSGKVDESSKKTFKGHVRVTETLPLNDQAFIVGANINLQENDPSLDPKKYGRPLSEIQKTQKPAQDLSIPILILLAALVAVLGYILKRKVKIQIKNG